VFVSYRSSEVIHVTHGRPYIHERNHVFGVNRNSVFKRCNRIHYIVTAHVDVSFEEKGIG
jgi:hypothetical protein